MVRRWRQQACLRLLKRRRRRRQQKVAAGYMQGPGAMEHPQSHLRVRSCGVLPGSSSCQQGLYRHAGALRRRMRATHKQPVEDSCCGVHCHSPQMGSTDRPTRPCELPSVRKTTLKGQLTGWRLAERIAAAWRVAKRRRKSAGTRQPLSHATVDPLHLPSHRRRLLPGPRGFALRSHLCLAALGLSTANCCRCLLSPPRVARPSFARRALT